MTVSEDPPLRHLVESVTFIPSANPAAPVFIRPLSKRTMRATPISTLALLLAAAVVSGQEPETSATEKLKESVREWIETMREIQVEETTWERDKELLEGQRESLESEIRDLETRVKDAREMKATADKESVEDVAKRDALAKTDEMLSSEVRSLELGLVAKLPAFPAPLAADARVKELMAQVTEDSKRTGDEAKKDLTKRLNNVLNLLAEAEKWQQTVHLREELRETGDGRKFNMQVVYFGFGIAYAVNEGGDYALIGRPGEDGWKFDSRPELAPRIRELVDVLNGDVESKFINLPLISQP